MKEPKQLVEAIVLFTIVLAVSVLALALQQSATKDACIAKMSANKYTPAQIAAVCNNQKL